MAPPRRQRSSVIAEHGEPKYPYTTKPGTLRKLLKDIPEQPRPPKFTGKVLKAWGYTDSNDSSALRVLRQIGLLSESGETGVNYIGFMDPMKGPGLLGELLRSKYADLFNVVKDPARASAEELLRFFNTHSGGSKKVLEYQSQAFKALADHAQFDGVASQRGEEVSSMAGQQNADRSDRTGNSGTALHIDLHVHLPENKTALDYAGIFQSIAEHILGRKP